MEVSIVEVRDGNKLIKGGRLGILRNWPARNGELYEDGPGERRRVWGRCT